MFDDAYDVDACGRSPNEVANQVLQVELGAVRERIDSLRATIKICINWNNISPKPMDCEELQVLLYHHLQYEKLLFASIVR
jgi:hypothetical protein